MQNLRGQRVAHMLNAISREGVAIDHDDIVILDGYVRGVISGRDLLAHACQFEDLSSYQEWLKGRCAAISGRLHSDVSVEQIVDEVEAFIRRKYLQHSVGRCDAASI